MANGPADNLVEELKDTFVKPVTNTLNAVKKYTPSWLPGAKEKPVDTTWHDQQVQNATKSFTDDKSKPADKTAPAPAKKPATPPKYHKGTDYVPKTGPAVLKKGEAVLNNGDASKFREAKNKMADTKWSKDAKDGLGGKDENPPKEISHIVHHKTVGGGHHFEHHHTHPNHHPVEHHFAKDDDGMVEHMLQHAGTPNPGEQEADAGTPDNYQPGASPNVAIEAAASPQAMAGGGAGPAAGPQGA